QVLTHSSSYSFRFSDPSTTATYTLSLHDALPILPGAHHELAVEAAFRQRAAFVVAGVSDRAEPTVMVKNGDRPAVELEDGGDLKEELGLVAEAVPRGHGTHPLGAV